MLVIGIFGSYQTVQAAEIVAGYTALEIIEGILLSFGISVFTADMVTTLTEDPSTAQDEYWRETQAAAWAEYMEAVYEDERKKGGGGSGPTPTPGISGTDIPSFKEVIQNMKNTGKIVLGAAAGAGVWECMSKAVSSLWDKIMSNEPNKDELSQNPYMEKVCIGRIRSTVPMYSGKFFNVDDCWIYVDNAENVVVNYLPANKFLTVCSVSSEGELVTVNFYTYDLLEYGDTGRITSTPMSRENPDVGGNINYVSLNFNWYKADEPILGNYFNCPFYVNGKISQEYPRQLSKEEIWVHPDLQDTYKNNGKLEYPQQAPQPLQIPSIAQLTDLANKLNTNPQQAPNSVQELIDLLKQNPQPQPTVAPNPNPDPNPNPNPEVSPKPDDTDTDTDVNPDDYKADLRLVFPFCIPFDLVHLIQAFEAEPEAPVFEFPLDLELENPWTGKKILDYHHTFELDMSDYEPVIKIFRIFEIIFFIIGLLMITRQQMIKG